MQSTQNDPGKTLSATDARAGRIVKGGAMRRLVVTSTALGIIALALVYLFLMR